MSSLHLCKLGSLVFPIMLTQEAGEISEGKAAELIGLDLVSYRIAKSKTKAAVMGLIESLPSPLALLLDGTKGQQESLTKVSDALSSLGTAIQNTDAG